MLTTPKEDDKEWDIDTPIEIVGDWLEERGVRRDAAEYVLNPHKNTSIFGNKNALY